MAGAARADATLKASYLFNNTLSSSLAGAPSLTLIDPTGTSGFVTDNVFGNNRTVLHIGGLASPVTSQGGLTFDNSGSLITQNNYSVALSFKFEDRDNNWRRIVDVENRQSDDGFYVDPSNHLDIFPVSGSNVTWTNNAYQNVVLTVASDGTVNGYLQGVGSFTTNTSIMNIVNGNNPGNLVGLFVDNVVAGGQGEWSKADIAVANFYDGVMTQSQVDAFNTNPTAPPPAPGGVPEPSAWTMLIAGFGAAGAMLRRRRRAALAA